MLSEEIEVIYINQIFISVIWNNRMNNIMSWEWKYTGIQKSMKTFLEIIFLNNIYSTYLAKAKGAEYSLWLMGSHCCCKTLNYYLLYSLNCLTEDEPIGYIGCVWFQFVLSIKSQSFL